MTKLIANSSNLNFKKNNGLLTAVVQDIKSGNVLMVGYQNREAVDISIDTGLVTFWSRTKERLWTKGEESKNHLKIKESYVDCDNDCILYQVKAPTETCHLGSYSCFGSKTNFGFLTKLSELIIDRKNNMPEGSYTSSLFSQGIDRIAQKVGEEAIETVIAAKNEDKKELLDESSDLLFHLLVLLAEKDLNLGDVIKNLEERSF